MGRERVEALAAGFRTAIERLSQSDFPAKSQLRECKFPGGTCDEVSMLLAAFFVDHGFSQPIFVRGGGGGGRKLNHTWLEINGDLVDITADQFQEMKGHPVIVASETSFHNSFETERSEQSADFRVRYSGYCSFGVDWEALYRSVYDLILKNVDPHFAVGEAE